VKPVPWTVERIRLEDAEDPSLLRIDGYRIAGTQRPQPGGDLVGELLVIIHDQQRGRYLPRLGDQFGVPEEQLRQQDRPLVIGQPSLPGTHDTIMPPG